MAGQTIAGMIAFVAAFAAVMAAARWYYRLDADSRRALSRLNEKSTPAVEHDESRRWADRLRSYVATVGQLLTSPEDNNTQKLRLRLRRLGLHDPHWIWTF